MSFYAVIYCLYYNMVGWHFGGGAGAGRGGGVGWGGWQSYASLALLNNVIFSTAPSSGFSETNVIGMKQNLNLRVHIRIPTYKAHKLVDLETQRWSQP